jgi:hypothetical protein
MLTRLLSDSSESAVFNQLYKAIDSGDDIAALSAMECLDSLPGPALVRACSRGRELVVQQMLNESRTLEASVLEDSLCAAASDGHLDILRLMLPRLRLSTNALYAAVVKSQLGAVRLLLDPLRQILHQTDPAMLLTMAICIDEKNPTEDSWEVYSLLLMSNK